MRRTKIIIKYENKNSFHLYIKNYLAPTMLLTHLAFVCFLLSPTQECFIAFR